MTEKTTLKLRDWIFKQHVVAQKNCMNILEHLFSITPKHVGMFSTQNKHMIIWEYLQLLNLIFFISTMNSC